MSERVDATGSDGDGGDDADGSVEPNDGEETIEDDANEDGSDEESRGGTTVVEEARPTRRWHGVTAFALVALGLGAVAGQASLLLASAFGLAFAGYGALTTAPEPILSVERTVSDREPDPGDEVTVSVTVTNEGDGVLPDLRFVDGVPDRLTVAEGTPRHGTALAPGGEATFSYVVTAARGEHTFDPLTALVRDVSGANERTARVHTRERITCEPALPTRAPPFPLRTKTSQFTGRFPADAGGPGVEFYSTREYRTGDPLSRIDWKRTARTGELTTVEYRVERTVRVVLVIDTRAEAYLAPDRFAVSAVDRAVEAAGSIYVSLTDEGHDVGLATLGPHDVWLAPGQGDEHRVRLQETVGTHPALSPEPPEETTNIYAATERLKSHLPADVQVVVLSPLPDQLVASAAIRLDAHGYPATVVSPDPTAIDTPGHTLAAIERRLRIADLRSRAVPVIDWHTADDFDHALARTHRRWST